MLVSKNKESTIGVNNINIYIRESVFLLTESVDGKLNINKITLGNSKECTDMIRINPRSRNEIEVF